MSKKKDKNIETEETQSVETEVKEVEKAHSLEDEIESLNSKIMYQAAEFDNFRKRTQKERAELTPFITANIISGFLPLLDNFERAAEAPSSDGEYKNGIEQILKQFVQILEKYGVEEIEAVNEKFDPELHEAVSQVTDENFGANIICNVLQKGYKLGDKIIRHAMVVVAN